MTDSKRIQWLIKHCNYLENDGVKCVDGFWPHEEGEGRNFNPDYLGMTLVEYLDAKIAEEEKAEQEEFHRQAADRIDQLIEARLYREVE